MHLGVDDVDFNLAYIPKNSNQHKVFSCENLKREEKQTLTDDLLWCAEQKNDSAKKIAHVMHQVNLFFGILFKLPIKRTCQMGKNFLVIDPDGSIRPCFHSNSIWGNVNNLSKTKEIIKKQKKEPVCISKQCSSLFAINSFWTGD